MLSAGESHADCIDCKVANSQRHPLKARMKAGSRRKERPRSLYHTDLTGPFRVPQLPAGDMYALNMVHADSAFSVVYGLPDKTSSKICTRLGEFKRWARLAIRTLISDGGKEYTGRVAEFCKRHGIQHITTAPHSPEQNAIAESRWRCAYAVARVLLSKANLPEDFLLYALKFANQVHIRTLPATTPSTATPYEQYMGEQPTVSWMRTFGCLAVLHNEGRLGKVDARGKMAIYLGPAEGSFAHLLWDPIARRECRSRSVHFFEDRPGGDLLVNLPGRQPTLKP